MKNKQSLIAYLKHAYNSKELIQSFVVRDLKIKYAQTVLGIGWVLLQPLTGMFIFSFFFTKVIGVTNWELPTAYPLFAYSGIISWLLFINTLQTAGTSLLSEESLIKKVYFPRLVLPITKSINALIDFVAALLLLIVIGSFYGVLPSWRLLFIPVVILILQLVSFGPALWLSALTIRYRDFHHIIPYIVGFGIWLTPVFYPASLLPDSLRWLYQFNPVATSMDMLRWSVLGTPFPPISHFCSLFISVVILVLGLLFFKNQEKILADYL